MAQNDGGYAGAEAAIVNAAQNRGLPTELAATILRGQGSDLLEAIANSTYDHELSDILLPIYIEIAPDILQRWIRLAHGYSNISSEIKFVSCVARILPFVPYLQPILRDFIRDSPVLRNISSTLQHLQELSESDLVTLLTALFRLLSQDRDAFTSFAKPVFLAALMKHKSPSVRFLTIECFCIVMKFADKKNQDLIKASIGESSCTGHWEGKQIDYRLLKLYEERRWRNLRNSLTNPQSERLLCRFNHSTDLHPAVVSLGGVILSLRATVPLHKSHFVEFSTSNTNLKSTAVSLRQHCATLLVGPGGSGKTAIVRELAHRLGMASKLTTLHLNDQTDAKGLLGIYTSSLTGSGFSWQPGVLTKAVQEGRWLLIEDIDRASAEVMGLLRPLIENNELFLPSRKERLRPTDGFRIFGTVRPSGTKSLSTGRHPSLSNDKLWTIVPILNYTSQEVEVLLRTRFSLLNPFLAALMSAHAQLVEIYAHDPAFKAIQGRLPTIRDLLKWCRRLNRRLQGYGSANSQLVPETFSMEMLKDGIDCYVNHISDLNLAEALATAIASNLNIAPVAALHAFKYHDAIVQQHKSYLQIGRARLSRTNLRRKRLDDLSKFALTRRVRQDMEAVAVSIEASEPLLLVGETGVGKTTMLQYLAAYSDKNMIVVNLSNQSEASDLLGGLKPVTTRSLVVPLIDEFYDLFDITFSAKNVKFRDSFSKAFARQHWTALVKHWDEAVELALRNLSDNVVEDDKGEKATKRRKLDGGKTQKLRNRWLSFGDSVSQVKAQIQRGEHNQVFAFVESRLVQAVRTGGWLLLDEINLASPETLDNILSLVHNGDDDKPHLLLAEAGNVERIDAHPDFRVFAAMNPATDTGKKDLPPTTRAHFTELFVQSGDSDINDLVEVVRVYLDTALINDQRAATDLAQAYLSLKRLNTEHRLTDGAGDLPHFSLRSLTRCLQYVQQHSASHGLRKAMLDGIQMSFFTLLNLDSQRIAQAAVEQHLMSSVQAKKALLSQKPRSTVDKEHYVSFSNHLVIRGPVASDHQPHYIITKSVRQNLMNLARAASMVKFPILLQGPTSAGKTSMVEYLAKYSGNRFVRINNHEHTDLQEYLGSYTSGSDGKLQYQEGVLVEALRKGYWIVLDELNLAPSDVLEALNRLLDDNRELLIPETQELVRPHPNFMLFATQNPAGLYGGRKRLSRAFRNRFLEIHVDDIPENELKIILEERAKIPPSYCEQIVEIYKKLSLQRQSSRLFEAGNSFATLRDLFRWASRPLDDRQALANHGYMLLAERVRDPAEKAIVQHTIEDTLKLQIDPSALYSEQKIPDNVKNSGTITWTRAMRRLFALVSAALENNEPVLLVGETGCGKTQVCQCLAHAYGKQLTVYNAHSNTETGDLIGSQRPVRHKSELAEAVVRDLRELGDQYAIARATDSMDIEDLITQFRSMETASFDPKVVNRVKSSIAAYQSLFVWSDGSLVRAMKEGGHFLLDEISLADDSVLERMNSLLEPGRTILLAEKGAEDNFVVAEPGFQFLATMNPGGDYGKRELSAALRNRLTEIWVPPLTDDEDVIPILRTRLPNTLDELAPKMVAFANFFGAHIQSSSNKVIPLRLLLSWADFVSQNEPMGLSSAIIHGAAMAFIDSLGANPAGLSSGVASDVPRARESCLRELEKQFNLDAVAIYNVHPVFELLPTELRIGEFRSSRSVAAPIKDEVVFEAPTTLQNAMRVLRALQADRPLLLEGNPGVGKTAIVAAMANLCGRRLTRVNLSDQTDLMDLFGADAPAEGEKMGNFVWKDGPLLKAMQSGEWVLLDEMNLASQSVLEGLNACLDHRKEVYIAELDQTFRCHPGFTLFATQNPHSQGGGRKGLPSSFVNRFTVVYADPFTQSDLEQICRVKHPNIHDEEIRKIVTTVSDCQALANQQPSFAEGAPWELNLRDLNRWVDACSHRNHIDATTQFKTVIASRFRNPIAREQAMQVCEQSFGCQTQDSLYHNVAAEHVQIGSISCERNTEFQHTLARDPLLTTQLAAAQSFLTAWEQKWPLILVGPTRSGKTQLIRSLAALRGDQIVEFSMNADVDTADLIGGYEQYDPGRVVQELLSELQIVLRELVSIASEDFNPRLFESTVKALEEMGKAQFDISAVMQAVKPIGDLDLPHHHLEAVATVLNKLHEISIAPTNDSTRFVWADGILIEALRSGSWLVLDHANLCNPSVLDRLNSLLEPDGSMILSEQHGIDGNARIVRPAPGFRIILTMDPKYGELSRAMRNRSLEIYLDFEANLVDNLTTLPSYPAASAIERLRPLFICAESSEASGHAIAQIEPYVESLTGTDLQPLQDQVSNQLPSQIENEIRIRLHEYAIKPVNAQARDTIKKFEIKSYARPHTWPRLLAINETALREIFDSATRLKIPYGVWMQLMNVSFLRCVAYLNDIEHAGHLNMSGSWLVRTVPRNLRSKRQHKVPLQAFQFLQDLGSFILSLFHAVDLQKIDEVFVALIQDIVMLFIDLTSFLDQGDVRSNEIQAYVQILDDLGHNIAENLPEHVEAFSTSTKRLGKPFQLESGQSLQRMWPRWRAKVAATQQDLGAILVVESFITRFDKLAKGLPQPRLQLAAMRLRLLDLRGKISAKSEAQKDLTDLEQAVEELGRAQSNTVAVNGHFETTFDILLYKARLQDISLSVLTEQIWSLFGSTNISRIPTETNDHSPLGLLTRMSHNAEARGTAGYRLELPPGEIGLSSIASKLQKVTEQPLGRLRYAQEELSELIKALTARAKTATTRNIESIINYGLELAWHVLLSHQDLLCPESRQACLHGNFKGRENLTLFREAVSSAEKAGYVWIAQQLKIVHDACLHLSSGAVFEAQAYADCGRGILKLAFACLRLLVPDKVFDPATYPALVADRHNKRIDELRDRLSSWQDFQKVTTGQSSSLVIRTLEQRLDDLGPNSVAEAVYRPDTSELDALQAEFTNLLRSLINANIVEGVASEDWQESSSSVGILVGRVERCAERLRTVNRAYDDMVVPVLGLLDAINLGARMVSYALSLELINKEQYKRSNEQREMPEMQPNPRQNNPRLHSLTSLMHDDLLQPVEISEIRSIPTLWESLKQLKLKLLIGKRQGQKRHTIIAAINEAIEYPYTLWYKQLKQDQDEAEKQSRYYSYRGEDDSDELSEKEVSQLFPRHDDVGQENSLEPADKHEHGLRNGRDDEIDMESHDTAIDVRQSATELARYHRSLFLDTHGKDLLKNHLVDRFSCRDETHADFKEGDMLAYEIMPSLMLKLQQTQERLSGSTTGRKLNIYSDHDVSETHKLFQISMQTISRFEEIAANWPDHAVPQEVLEFCKQVMALKINEPIAKLLTKTEKLLEIVTQWQTIASREWSVANIVESLTNLIIHWRQLELSSWSRLLDEEDQKQQENADMWYFIAYESVIYNSLQLVENIIQGQVEEDLTAYSRKLAMTLEDYLRNTTLGQFAGRLGLLRAFAETLRACALSVSDDETYKSTVKASFQPDGGSHQVNRQHLSGDKSSNAKNYDYGHGKSYFTDKFDTEDEVDNLQRRQAILNIHNTVLNVVKHYSRYHEHIHQILITGRSALEKKITEQIKLASWKDTNITALRESARRSHFKLFRVVKKYRQLLGQPLTSFASKYTAAAESPAPQFTITDVLVSSEMIQRQLKICQHLVKDWESRPTRLKNPIASMTTMRHVYSQALPSLEASLELESWMQDISTAAGELRKATPSIASEDNTSLIKDLKQRKRRLLADTMKEVANMGIRRNLGNDDLVAQSSTALVLANLAPLNWKAQEKSAHAVDAAFHELLDALPVARQAALEHSDELTDGETSRGLGFLEGFLSLAIKQRGQLSALQSQLGRFSVLSEKLNNLHNLESMPRLMVQADQKAGLRYGHLLTWLPQVLELYAEILGFQGLQGGLEVKDMVSSMQEYATRLDALQNRLQNSLELPDGLVDTDKLNILQEAESIEGALRDHIRQWSNQEPQAEPVLRHLNDWMLEDPGKEADSNGIVSLDVQTVSSRSETLLNKVFVSLQRLSNRMNALPTSTEDKGWLVKATEAFSGAVNDTKLDIISNELQETLKLLHTVDSEGLNIVVPLLAVAAPIILQFEAIVKDAQSRLLHLHLQTSRTAVYLAKTFTTLAKEGFCTPAGASDGQEQEGKVEQGTGLGEGDAAQDISKDVGDDEDLTDLAQEGGEREDGTDEMDKSKDAIDMGVEDLEGEMGSGDDQASGDEQNSDKDSSDEQELDEETGSVDDLDPSAVDEKMWDDMQKEAEKEEKEMKSQTSKGQKNDDQTARTDGQEQEGNESDLEANDGDEEMDDQEGTANAEGENIDPHLDQEQNLDLPDDVHLNGEEDKDDGISDADMNDLSDVDDDAGADMKKDADLPDEDKEERQDVLEGDESVNNEEEEDGKGRAKEDEVVEDIPNGEEEADDLQHDSRQDDTMHDTEEQAEGDSGAAAGAKDDVDAHDENAPQGQNDAEAATQASEARQRQQTSTEEQQGIGEGSVEQGIGRQDPAKDKQAQSLQKLADVLERYHQRREIFTQDETRQQAQATQDIEMDDADFEHAGDQEDDTHTQALGATNQEHNQNIDRDQAIEDSHANPEAELPMPEETEQPDNATQAESLAQKMTRMQREQAEKQEPIGNSAVIPERVRERPVQNETELESTTHLDEMDLKEESSYGQRDIATTLAVLPQSTSLADAQHLWSITTTKTQALSLMLTEQLRLILQPTTATKLRGDFRTGKRLNIRRIIPYIASGYKRDKIWMRRSVPSKRNYQIMLAVDDSKSMAESGADILALETLCMLSRSLSMLEAGELSIVAFGKDYNNPQEDTIQPRAVKVAHPFSSPFSPSTSGPETFSNFTFNQTGTNIHALLAESISLFKDARIKSSAREAADLWQLQIIISDGHIGSDERISRLVRRAREEKIMSVFVVVDNSRESIVDLKQVYFEKVERNGREELEPRTKRYLEEFPFQYYVVVREVRDLPGVLGRVLKGWFEGVVEMG